MAPEQREKNSRLKRVKIFRQRCRYFTDAGVLGRKSFVQEVFDEVKSLLGSKDERKFVSLPVEGKVYSLKRLQK